MELALREFRDTVNLGDPIVLDTRHRDLIGLHSVIVHKAYKQSRDRIFESIEKHFDLNQKIDPKKEKIIEDLFKDLLSLKLKNKFTHEDIILQEQIYQNARAFADDVIRYRMKMKNKTVDIPERKEPLLFPDEPNKPINVDIEIKNHMKELITKLEKFVDEEALSHKNMEPLKLKVPFFKESTIKSFNEVIKKYGILFLSIFLGIGVVKGLAILGISHIGLDPQTFSVIEEYIRYRFVPIYLIFSLYLTPRLYEPFQKFIERFRKYQKLKQL